MLFRGRSNSKDNSVTPSDSILMNTEFKSDLDSLVTLESRGAEMVSHLHAYLTQNCGDHLGVPSGNRFHISASLHGRSLDFRIELFWGKSRVEGAIRAYVRRYYSEASFAGPEEVLLELDNPFTFDVLGNIKSSKEGVDTPASFSPRFVAAVMRALREKGVSFRPDGDHVGR